MKTRKVLNTKKINEIKNKLKKKMSLKKRGSGQTPGKIKDLEDKYSNVSSVVTNHQVFRAIQSLSNGEIKNRGKATPPEIIRKKAQERKNGH